LVRELL
jgi:hypothetical protein